MSANIYSIRGGRENAATHVKIHFLAAQYSREKVAGFLGRAALVLRLLEGDESGAVGGSDTGPTVLHRLVGDGELAQVMSNRLWLDLNLCEDLAVVNSNNGAGHLGDNDHVPEVGLDHVGLLVGGSLLLLLPQLLDQGHWLPLESPGELPPDPAYKQLHQLLVVHVEKLVQINSTVSELTESPLFLQFDIMVSHGDGRSNFSCRSESSNKSL